MAKKATSKQASSRQPMTTAEMQRLARSYVPQAFKALEDIAENASCEQARREAKKILAERAYLRHRYFPK